MPCAPPWTRSRSTRSPTRSTSSVRPARARRLVEQRGAGRPRRRPAGTRGSWPCSSPKRSTPAPPRHVLSVEVAGPGFVNFRLADSWLHDVLADVVDQGVDGYARLDLGAGTKVMVEFVSANPTGPLHAGHGRGAAFGDSLARVLEQCGYEVVREDLPQRPRHPDGGVLRFADRTARRHPDARGGLQRPVHRRLGRGDARGRRRGRVGRGSGHRRSSLGARADEHPLRLLVQRAFAGRVGRHRRHAGRPARAGCGLRAGRAIWLRSTDFGDDKDRVLVRSDGEPTYLLPDIAYHRASSVGASTCSSTCGAPTTMGTCRG